jgi:hypothetical protein
MMSKMSFRSSVVAIAPNYSLTPITKLKQMETNNLNIEKTYIITYTNLIEFEGNKLAFREKELFNINSIPKHIKRSDQGWWIGRKLLTTTKAKELYKNTNYEVDVTELQWYTQIELDAVFNLHN